MVFYNSTLLVKHKSTEYNMLEGRLWKKYGKIWPILSGFFSFSSTLLLQICIISKTVYLDFSSHCELENCFKNSCFFIKIVLEMHFLNKKYKIRTDRSLPRFGKFGETLNSRWLNHPEVILEASIETTFKATAFGLFQEFHIWLTVTTGFPVAGMITAGIVLHKFVIPCNVVRL